MSNELVYFVAKGKEKKGTINLGEYGCHLLF